MAKSEIQYIIASDDPGYALEAMNKKALYKFRSGVICGMEMCPEDNLSINPVYRYSDIKVMIKTDFATISSCKLPGLKSDLFVNL
jgi:opacity protein-like surface antigen